MLAYKEDGRRKFDSYADEATAIQEANKKAGQISTLGVKAAQLTDDELRVCVTAMDAAKPLNLSLDDAVKKLLEAVAIVGDVPKVIEACNDHKARHKTVRPKRVADVVAELLALKERHGASLRYLQDLRNRLGRFAEAFRKDACNISTPDISAWFDSQKFSPANYMGFYRVVHLLFEFCVARGYSVDNPAVGVEILKKFKRGKTQVFSPQEIVKLLDAAEEKFPEFVPCIAIGAFAGLRSAEIERLEWTDVHFDEKCIVVGEDKAKTASRRIVPVTDNLLEWLRPYAGQGKIWKNGHDQFYDLQQDVAEAAGIKWKINALRHSFASYSFALTNDAGRIAGFLGNSAAVVHRHYKELVKPADAQRWFSVRPAPTANVIPLSAAAVARGS